jgi:bacterioferritin
MKLENLIDLLNQDLSREYSHWHFYMSAATSVRGLHREELKEFFIEEAQGEMKHVQEFRELIQGILTRRNLNKKITELPCDFNANFKDPKDLLTQALKMEEEVVKNYVERIQQAADLQNNGAEDAVDGKYIELFLEDQILASRHDADNIREMLL